jgi:hypothetical protein
VASEDGQISSLCRERTDGPVRLWRLATGVVDTRIV